MRTPFLKVVSGLLVTAFVFPSNGFSATASNQQTNSTISSAQSPSNFQAAQNNSQSLVDSQNVMMSLMGAQVSPSTVTANLLPSQTSAIVQWCTANQSANLSGLVTSYPSETGFAYLDGIQDEAHKVFGNTQAYTYDQAISGMVFLADGNLSAAKKIFDFFHADMAAQGGAFNGFWTVYNVNTAQAGKKYEYNKRVGETVFLAMFMLQYADQTQNASDKAAGLQDAVTVARWVASLSHNAGGVSMGNIGGNPDWSRIYSVENNLDYYAFLKMMLGSKISQSDRTLFTSELNGVHNWLRDGAYDKTTGLFRRGGSVNASNVFTWDSIASLDCNSWAVNTLGASDLQGFFGIDPSQFVAVIEANFMIQDNNSFGGNSATARGFDFSNAANAGIIGRQGVKWVEGTAQMVQAYRLFADYFSTSNPTLAADYRARADHFESRDLEQSTNVGGALSFLYADRSGVQIYAWEGNRTGVGVAAPSTAWSYFAGTGRNPFVMKNVQGTGADLLAVLQADSSVLTAYNAMFGTNIPAVGAVSGADAPTFFGMAGDPNFNRYEFMRILPQVYSLYIAVQSNGSQRAAYNSLFSANISASGSPIPSDRGGLFDIVGDPSFNQANFLAALPKTFSLYTAIKGSVSNISDFNSLYGAAISSVAPLSAGDRKTLFDISATPAFDQPSFISVMPKAASLYSKLKLNPSALSGFNVLYGSALQISGALSASNRTVLFGVAGEPGFSEVAFLIAIPKTASLYTVLQAPAVLPNFNLFYDAALSASGPPSKTSRDMLFAITLDAAYNQVSFLSGVNTGASLLTNLRLAANQAKLVAFNSLFGATVTAVGAPIVADRSLILGVVNAPGFSQTALLNSLAPAGDLLTALRLSADRLAALNNLYNQVIPASGKLNDAQRTFLFSISSTTGYLQTTYINGLVSTGNLLVSLRASTVLKKYFKLLYVFDPALTPVLDGFRTALYAITGNSSYDAASYLTALPKAGFLYEELQGASKGKLKKFNKRYSTSIVTTGAPTAHDLGVLYTIVNDPRYVPATFWKKLKF